MTGFTDIAELMEVNRYCLPPTSRLHYNICPLKYISKDQSSQRMHLARDTCAPLAEPELASLRCTESRDGQSCSRGQPRSNGHLRTSGIFCACKLSNIIDKEIFCQYKSTNRKGYKIAIKIYNFLLKSIHKSECSHYLPATYVEKKGTGWSPVAIRDTPQREAIAIIHHTPVADWGGNGRTVEGPE